MAAAAALGALKHDKPVRLVLDTKTNMELVGKRYSYLIKYNVSSN
jgi:xanthine dehydrogenase molybdopterin-binding subunit B